MISAETVEHLHHAMRADFVLLAVLIYAMTLLLITAIYLRGRK